MKSSVQRDPFYVKIFALVGMELEWLDMQASALPTATKAPRRK